MAFDYAYGNTTLGELNLHGVHHATTGKFQLTSVTIEGQLVIPSRGFVKSLCKRFAISRHEQAQRTSGELLGLLVRSFPLAAVKYRIEWDESGTTWLFACESPSASTATLQPASDDNIPSPESRLAEYGFGPPQQLDEFHSRSASTPNGQATEQDWPLLRDHGCQVPAFPFIPADQPSSGSRLFIHGPAGTPRSSMN